MSRILTILFAVITLASAQAAEQTIKVGGKVIKIQPPEGMVRCDGHWAEWDRLLAAPVPPGNRLIAVFAPPEALEMVKKQEAPTLQRYAMIQTVKSIESREVGQKTFADIRSEIKTGIDTAIKGGEVEKASKDADARLDKAIGEDMEFGISNTKILGYFNESDKTMLGFTMAMKVTVDGDETKELASAITTAVNGRMVNFNVYSPFGGPADRSWVEKTVSAWKTAIVQANPQPQGPRASSSGSSFGGFDWGQAIQKGAIGAVIGGIVAAVLALLKKRKS